MHYLSCVLPSLSFFILSLSLSVCLSVLLTCGIHRLVYCLALPCWPCIALSGLFCLAFNLNLNLNLPDPDPDPDPPALPRMSSSWWCPSTGKTFLYSTGKKSWWCRTAVVSSFRNFQEKNYTTTTGPLVQKIKAHIYVSF